MFAWLYVHIEVEVYSRKSQRLGEGVAAKAGYESLNYAKNLYI